MFAVRSAFLSSPRIISTEDLFSAIQDSFPSAEASREGSLELIRWETIDVSAPVRNAWIEQTTVESRATHCAFLRTTPEGSVVALLSPSEDAVLDLRAALSKRFKADEVSLDVTPGTFFERLPSRIARYSELTGEPTPYLSLGGLLILRSGMYFSAEIADADTDNFGRFIEAAQALFATSSMNVGRLQAAYVSINGTAINFFGNGTAAILTDEFQRALDASRAAAILFDFQMTPA